MSKSRLFTANTLPSDYLVMSYENGNVVSCWRETEIQTKHKGDCMSHVCSDDFGPQRFDRDGNALEMSDESGVWVTNDDEFDEILVDASAVEIRDDFAVDGPTWDNVYINRDYHPKDWDIFEEVKCSNEQKDYKDMAKSLNLEWYIDKMGLDIYGLKKLKLDRNVARFIWDNKDTLKDLYKDIDDDWDENVPNTFNDESHHNSMFDYDTVANEEGTHQDIAQLKFWKSMIFYIGKAPNKVDDLAFEKFIDGVVSLDELDYVHHITGGVKNTGKMRYAQKIMMDHAAFRKCHDVLDTDPKHTLEYIENSKYKPQPVNPALRKYRIIDVYEPTINLKEGFILQVDYIRGKFCNAKQWRIIGKEKCLKFYADKVEEAYSEGFAVHNRNITKLKQGVVYFQMWNLWLSNVKEYCNQVKAMLK